MIIDIKVPSVGESITEAILAEWFKKDGARVAKDDVLFVLETDKVTLEVAAEADGVLKVLVAEGETVAIGAVVGTIDTAGAQTTAPTAPSPEPDKIAPAAPTPPPEKTAPPITAAAPIPPAAATAAPEKTDIALSPAVRRLVAEHRLDAAAITGTGPGGRITKGDVLLHLEQTPAESAPAAPSIAETAPAPPATTRKPMSPIRRRIAARLLEAKQGTAMLTTFNEIDMGRAMDIRSRYKDAFKKKFGISLGFMSFFTAACVAALREIPEINAFIDGDDIIYNHGQHIGIAIGNEKGLVVPVIRNAQDMTFADIEKAIVVYVEKINTNRLSLADLEGGTFTISNGGVYGSLLSTPILNPPQSAILGMHKIEKRPVVVDDQIVIRPMMYVALSYDHRVVDGKGAVTFLKRVKEFVENPERIMMEI
ncbi:MAG: 2-oxoglutarate dehydrogenase complex dihydrolipoyllysine-residue succinyltransferase [Pseudomonadota bacterium]